MLRTDKIDFEKSDLTNVRIERFQARERKGGERRMIKEVYKEGE